MTPLGQVKQAIRDYHFALDTRQHGEIAMSKAINEIMVALDMVWKQGVEARRRAARERLNAS